MKFLIKLSYDGSGFIGYQRQPNLRTVQGEVEDVLTRINNGKKVIIHGSGRTDRGVHAFSQYVHALLDVDITSKKLKRAMNSYLPDDIHVVKVEEVGDGFHARYSVLEKEYKYILNMGEYNPVERNYVFQYNHVLNLTKMKSAIRYFVGEHDFRAFVTDSHDKPNCVRTISKASISKNGDKLTFIFRGNGFLRYQVRNMVGVLIRVGEKNIDPSYVKAILESRDRSKNGVTAPAEGLYLTDVVYKNKEFVWKRVRE